MACVKDKPNPPDTGFEPISGRKVYFINEGNYGSGNASLAVLDLQRNKMHNDIYTFVNNKALGDVFQSMCNVDGKLYLAINHSDKIVVCNPKTMYEEAVIEVYSPRYFLPINITKVYISSLYSNSIFVLNTQTQTIEKEIVLPTKSVEEMLLHNGYVYASSWDEKCNVIYKINPLTDAIEQEIPFGGYAAQNFLVDKQDNIWIKYGNIQKGKPYGFAVYNPVKDSIMNRFVYIAGENEIIKPAINKTKDTLYWINVDYSSTAETETGLFRMDINSSALPTAAFYKAVRFQYFYALAIDPLSQLIYLGDPKGFTESSEVIVISSNGEEVNRFRTGMGIGDFYFDSE